MIVLGDLTTRPSRSQNGTAGPVPIFVRSWVVHAGADGATADEGAGRHEESGRVLPGRSISGSTCRSRRSAWGCLFMLGVQVNRLRNEARDQPWTPRPATQDTALDAGRARLVARATALLGRLSQRSRLIALML